MIIVIVALKFWYSELNRWVSVNLQDRTQGLYGTLGSKHLTVGQVCPSLDPESFGAPGMPGAETLRDSAVLIELLKVRSGGVATGASLFTTGFFFLKGKFGMAIYGV